MNQISGEVRVTRRHLWLSALAAWLVCWLPLSWASSPVGGSAPRILVLGDSLSAGYGISPVESWVHLLEQRLADKYPHRVINASVSGETTGGGLARLPALLLQHQPQIVVLELGGNDGLRGHPLGLMHQQLAQMIQLSKDSGAQVLLLGMRIPPNYGQRYTEQFHRTYTQLAEEFDVPLVPFFLQGVADNTQLMQRDGIHPTAAAQRLMLENVWPTLEALLSAS